jgi:hypothetical protein
MKQKWVAHEALLSEIESRLKYTEEEGFFFLYCIFIVLFAGKQRKVESKNLEQQQAKIIEEIKSAVLKEFNLQLSILEGKN